MFKIIRDFDVKGKRVLVRCDFNVPLSEEGEVTDDFRIRQTIPTIEYLKEKGAKVILISHFGRPDDKFNKEYSLKPVAQRLESLLNQRVKFLDDCIGEKVEKELEKIGSGEIVLLENLRFYKEEEENNEKFARKLSSLGDIFINDAFGASHRAHASISGIVKFLPAGAGFLLEKEFEVLNNLITNPQKPLISIIGGKKVETKAGVIDKISETANYILIGDLIKLEIENKKIKLKNPQKIVKPIDNVDTFDIGPKTVALFKEKIKIAKTVFWSGPLGMIEKEKYQKGSKEIARAIIDSGSFSVVGGGETVEFINKVGLASKFNFVSTGGGAMLEFLAGEKLPGIEVLCSAS